MSALTFEVLVPVGASAGSTLEITAPNGVLMHVVIPEGLAPGQTFTAQAPAGQPTGAVVPAQKPKYVREVDGLEQWTGPQDKFCGFLMAVLLPVFLPCMIFSWTKTQWVRFDKQNSKMMVMTDYYLKLWLSKKDRVEVNEAPLSQVSAQTLWKHADKNSNWAVVLHVYGGNVHKHQEVQVAHHPPWSKSKADEEAAVWSDYLRSLVIV